MTFHSIIFYYINATWSGLQGLLIVVSTIPTLKFKISYDLFTFAENATYLIITKVLICDHH